MLSCSRFRCTLAIVVTFASIVVLAERGRADAANTLTITSPKSSARVSKSVPIVASTGPSVSRVDFYVDGNYQTSSPPYTYDWNSTAVVNGSHTIKVKAYSTSGALVKTASVVVRVSNSNSSPTVRFSSPAAGATVSGSATVTASVSPAVSWCDFYVDGNYLLSSPPYSFSWDSTSVANGSHTFRVNAFAQPDTKIGTSTVTVVVSNPTRSHSPTPTATPTTTPTHTATPTATKTATATPKPTASATAKPTATVTGDPTVSATAKPTATVTATTTATPTATSTAAAGGLSVRVQGNHLVDGAGNTIRLLGVNRSGTEYQCVSDAGIFDGPSDEASVAAMASWNINTVRVPLNEDCWLGINGVDPSYSGANYQTAIVNYVNLLHKYNLYAQLDLHWNAPGSELATGQLEMADADHSPAFWTSVATTFKNDPAVVFDLYNEPYVSTGADQDSDWSCWLNGCTIDGSWQAAGMQSLVDAVRNTGATQPLVLSGCGWGNDLYGWLANMPNDPLNSLVASVHTYDNSGCADTSCWNDMVAPVAAQVPVVTGEFGEYDCTDNIIVNPLMNWSDENGVGYLAWAWDTGPGWNCSSGPGIINDYSGTPNALGIGIQSHLLQIGP